MSLLKKNRAADPVVGLVNHLRTAIANQGGALVTADQTKNVLSFESLNERDFQSLDAAATQISETLKQDAISCGLESFNATTADAVRQRDVALAAGAIAAMASGNPVDYARRAVSMEGATAPRNGVLVDFNREGTDYRDDVASLEAFDERELVKFMPYSIAFNVFASRQDEFSEKFYPTTVVTPDQAGIDVTVARVMVFNEVKHAMTGKQVDFGKKSLIDAAVDATILQDQSTKLVPYRNADDSTAANFIDEVAHPGSVVKVAGIDVATAPLKMGPTIDVLGLSQYTPLIGAGVYDQTDNIDTNAGIDALYMIPGYDAGPVARKAVKFSTAGMARSNFVKTPEGNSREVALTFKAEGLIIDENTKAIDGSAVTGFAAIASNHWTVRFTVLINGSMNVEFGNVTVYANQLTVDSIYDNATGSQVSTASGAGATLKALLEGYKIEGYDLRASRTNSNRRTRGLLLDTTHEVARYTIPLAAPISVSTPATGNDDAADLKALIAAARQRNSNNAVTALFAHAATLQAFTKGPKVPGAIAPIAGMGRFLVTPFFERHTLDLEASINSIKSHEKAADVSAVLINACRDLAYRMYRDSRIQAALNQLNGGESESPTLIVGTDQVLIRHLQMPGDTRTFGTVFDSAEVVSSQDSRMRNTIVLTFGRKNSDGPDPLAFGCHAWMPELTSTMPVNRNGATVKETMVQPRTLHFNSLPVMAIIDVQNLSKVLVDKVVNPAVDTDTSNPYLVGFTFT